MPSPSAVKVGPGLLYIAAAGTPLPADLTTAWGAAWTQMGYTEEGHGFTSTPSYDPIEVAEELLPIRYEATGAEYRVEFALAEITAKNFQTAFNGGTLTTSGVGAAQTTKFTPPLATADPIRVALGWQSQDGKERWVWYKCLQTGASERAARKAPAKATIPMSFLVEIPLTGGAAFEALFATPV